MDEADGRRPTRERRPGHTAPTNLLHRRAGAVSWRLGADDYLEALAAVDHTIPLTSPVDEAVWDHDLAAVMGERGRSLHEEQVLRDLLSDLDQRDAV